jgi:hypothetical protein
VRNDLALPDQQGQAAADFEVRTGDVHRAATHDVEAPNIGCPSRAPTSCVAATKNNGPGRARAGTINHGGSPQQGSLGSPPALIDMVRPRRAGVNDKPQADSFRLGLAGRVIYFVTWGGEGYRDRRKSSLMPDPPALDQSAGGWQSGERGPLDGACHHYIGRINTWV